VLLYGVLSGVACINGGSRFLSGYAVIYRVVLRSFGERCGQWVSPRGHILVGSAMNSLIDYARVYRDREPVPIDAAASSTARSHVLRLAGEYDVF
jgi:hypothetical protein